MKKRPVASSSHPCLSPRSNRFSSRGLRLVGLILLLTGSATAALTVGPKSLARVFTPAPSPAPITVKAPASKSMAVPVPTPKLRLPGLMQSIGGNLDQFQNGAPGKSPEWANGNINQSNSCYSEGDVIPYRYFVTGITDTNQHCFTIEYDFTKSGKRALDYLTNFDTTEAGPIATLTGGPCNSSSGAAAESNCVPPTKVADFPDPTAFLNANGYQGEALRGDVDLFGYNVKDVTFATGYNLIGSAAGDSTIQIRVCFKLINANQAAGFYWGGHIAKGLPGAWGTGNGASSITGSPFHMAAIFIDDGGRGNEDRSTSVGAVCAPPSSDFTVDAGPYCLGSTHTATAVAPNSGNNFTWSITGGEIISGQGTNTISFAVTAGCGGSVGLKLAVCPTLTPAGCPGDTCCSETSKSVIVNDTTKPKLSVPANVTVECGLSTTPPATGTATATDNCDQNVEITYTDQETAGTTCSTDKIKSTITRTWKAVDDCGNIETGTQIITVKDTIAPTLTAGTIAACYANADAAKQAAINATTVVEGCSAVTVSALVSGTCTATIMVTARDACGNEASVPYQTRIDGTGPTLSDFPTASAAYCVGTPVVVPTLTASDGCGAATITYTRSDGKLLTDPYPFGTTVITAVAKDTCGNESVKRTFTVLVTDCAQVNCSLTQGGWGNSNGRFNGERRIDTLNRLLTLANPLTIGWNGSGWMMTFVDGAEACLIAKMPAGGTPAMLPTGLALTVTNTCAVPSTLLNNGKFNNVLIGQTIALSLNTRLDVALGNRKICTTMVTAKALPGKDGKIGTSDDIPEAPGADANGDGIPDNYKKVTIPASVLQALGATPTVSNLLSLANRALGGLSTGGASLADINAAVDAINNAFDECRFLISCQ